MSATQIIAAILWRAGIDRMVEVGADWATLPNRVAMSHLAKVVWPR